MNIKPRQDEGRFPFLIRQFLMASSAAMFAETVTLPLDTVKVRL
jgi:solute carrier family 25 (mitochondrial uncoupling protein), member 8/9